MTPHEFFYFWIGLMFGFALMGMLAGLVIIWSDKPKRNCDRPFKTLAEFQRYYIEHGCKKGLGMVVDGEITKVPWKSNFEKWLLEPIDKKGD